MALLFYIFLYTLLVKYAAFDVYACRYIIIKNCDFKRKNKKLWILMEKVVKCKSIFYLKCSLQSAPIDLVHETLLYVIVNGKTAHAFNLGGAVAQSVKWETSGEEFLGSIPTGWVGFSIMLSAETEVMVSPLCLGCGST